MQTAVAAVIAVASLGVGVATALAEGGGVTPPKSPKAADVVCISTCGGVRKATTDSKVQISGHHLKQVSKVRVQLAPSRANRGETRLGHRAAP